MLQLTKIAKRINSNVEVGKFTALVIAAGTYNDGVDVPAAANAGPVAGVADESMLPEGMNDYSGGVYQIVSGTAWPANSIPSSNQYRRLSVVREGQSKAIGSGVIAVGDEVNIADSQGRLKTVNELAGTLVYIVGEAKSPCAQTGDVFEVWVKPSRRKL